MSIKLLRPSAAPRLTYLPIKGIAEPIRVVLRIAQVPFVDERIDYDEVARRRELGLLPGGQVPVLRLGGEWFSQSTAIMRWAAAAGGMGPRGAKEQLRYDMVQGALQDIQLQLRPQWYGSAMGRSPVTGEIMVPLNQDQKRDVDCLLNTEVLPTHFKRLESVLGASGGRWCCGERMTAADISLHGLASGILDGTYCQGISPQVLDDCPLLCGLVRSVGKLVADLN
eukprot:TRINITY_DN43410_c0_g1_i4.p1 TRINITY_DN43410_c0_g1~~TRINITY_DN43410_c0_g1_i4.p1  ORF type:complete len:225 (-),score=30.78 TRINITY_DN43410_c0_g1_i4:94-768(-)